MKFLFMDRDGVINKDPGGWTEHDYVTRWEDFHFLPGAKEALALLKSKGYDIIVISNQGGVSKNYFSKSVLDDITGKMLEEIEAAGGCIKKAYYCIHQDNDGCDCRKPKTGLFKQAEKELGIKAGGAWFIGDGNMDVEAGKAAGLKTALVLSGKSASGDVKEWDTKPDYIFKDLLEAVKFIVTNRCEKPYQPRG